jgi:hypothetical protein
MNERFYCRECGQFVAIDDLIHRVIPPQYSEAKAKAIYDAVQHEFSHVDCPRGDVMDLGAVPDIATIFGAIPDLPGVYTTPPECLADENK